MRVLLTAPCSTARLHNLVPLAWALRTGGHDVKFAGRPAFTETITRTGLVAVAAGEDGAAAPDWLADPCAVDSLADFATRWRADLVIWDQRAPAGSVAARAAGAASVRMLGIFDAAGTAAGDPDVGDRLDGSLDRHGLTLDDALVHGDATLDPTPPSLCTGSRRGHLPIRHVPYHGSAVIPGWLGRKPRRPRIYVSLAAAGQWLAPLFEAVGGLDVEVICVLPVDRIPDGASIPDNVRLFDTLPLNALLPTCSAIVHDGTTTAAALAYGLPQLVLTAAAEGATLGERLRSLTTDPAVRADAQRLRDEVSAMPSPRAVVPHLEALSTRR